MKKFVIFSVMVGAMAFAVPSAEAKSIASVDSTMISNAEQPRRWRNRTVRTVTRTRVTWVGRYRYRETYRTTYFANGRTQTRLISRVRIGGRVRY